MLSALSKPKPTYLTKQLYLIARREILDHRRRSGGNERYGRAREDIIEFIGQAAQSPLVNGKASGTIYRHVGLISAPVTHERQAAESNRRPTVSEDRPQSAVSRRGPRYLATGAPP